MSVKQFAQALEFIWEAWEDAEELQRAHDSNKKVELPPVLFAAPAGRETDACIAALAVAFKKTLSGGVGCRKTAYAIWQEMESDDVGVPGEWHDALGFLDWEDMEFIEGLWPRATAHEDSDSDA